MLVLTRKKDQGLKIGEDVELIVLEVRRDGKVRLGMLAPRDKLILRTELVQAGKQRAELAPLRKVAC